MTDRRIWTRWRSEWNSQDERMKEEKISPSTRKTIYSFIKWCEKWTRTRPKPRKSVFLHCTQADVEFKLRKKRGKSEKKNQNWIKKTYTEKIKRFTRCIHSANKRDLKWRIPQLNKQIEGIKSWFWSMRNRAKNNSIRLSIWNIKMKEKTFFSRVQFSVGVFGSSNCIEAANKSKFIGLIILSTKMFWTELNYLFRLHQRFAITTDSGTNKLHNWSGKSATHRVVKNYAMVNEKNFDFFFLFSMNKDVWAMKKHKHTKIENRKKARKCGDSEREDEGWNASMPNKHWRK